jgi:hypothetical protein
VTTLLRSHFLEPLCTMGLLACRPTVPCKTLDSSVDSDALLWGSQSWLQPPFRRLFAPGKASVSVARDAPNRIALRSRERPSLPAQPAPAAAMASPTSLKNPCAGQGRVHTSGRRSLRERLLRRKLRRRQEGRKEPPERRLQPGLAAPQRHLPNARARSTSRKADYQSAGPSQPSPRVLQNQRQRGGFLGSVNAARRHPEGRQSAT